MANKVDNKTEKHPCAHQSADTSSVSNYFVSLVTQYN